MRASLLVLLLSVAGVLLLASAAVSANSFIEPEDGETTCKHAAQ